MSGLLNDNKVAPHHRLRFESHEQSLPELEGQNHSRPKVVGLASVKGRGAIP